MKNPKKFWRKWKIAIILGLLLFFIAAFLRIYNLTNLPVFADEAIYIRWAQVMKAESTLRFLPLSDGKQPLFMWAVIPFLKVFSDPLFAGRFVSVLTGLATIVGIFVAAQILFNSKKVSLVAALIYCLSPFSLFFDRMALVDSMLAMFGVWVFIFATYTAKTLRFDFAMLTGFTLGGALLTKSPALFFSLLLPSTWLFAKWPKEKGKIARLVIRFIILFLVTYLIGYAMYNILRLGPNFQLLTIRNMDYVYPIQHIFQSPLDPFKGHMGGIVDYFIRLGPWAFVILLIFGMVRGFKKNYMETLVLLAWGIIPILVNAEFAKVLTARYLLFCLPFLAIIASQAVLFKGLPGKIVYVTGLVFIILALNQDRLLLTNVQAANLPHGERSGYLEEWTAGYGIQDVGNYLKAEKLKNPNSQFVVGTEGAFGTLPDGLQIYLNKNPDIIVIGLGIGFYKVPESLIDSKQAGNRTFLVINSTRMLIKDPAKSGLELVAAYPKALRRMGTLEYNLYGPQESLLFYELK